MRFSAAATPYALIPGFGRDVEADYMAAKVYRRELCLTNVTFVRASRVLGAGYTFARRCYEYSF